MQIKRKTIAFLLLCAMLIPTLCLSATAGATNRVYGSMDFDGLTPDKPIAVSDGFADVPVYSTVKNETVDGKTNRYVHVPLIGAESKSDTSNWDKSIRIKHDAINGGSFTFEADYRPHKGGSGAPIIEAQFFKYSFTDDKGVAHSGEGKYMTLFMLNLSNGKLTQCGTVVNSSVALKMDEWNRVRLVFDLDAGEYRVYVNDALYSVKENLTCRAGSTDYTGCTKLSLAADQIFVAKCGRQAGTYTSVENANTFYVDVDNVSVYETPAAEITLNGVKVSYTDGQTLQNFISTEKQFVYARVTYNGDTNIVYDPSLVLKSGMSIELKMLDFTAVTAEARVKNDLGIRFISQVNASDYQALKADPFIKNVQIGTLIFPKLTLDAMPRMDWELLQTKTYLNVRATDGMWYEVDETAGTFLFAGSIVDLLAKNYGRTFVGVGYIFLETADGNCIRLFAEHEKTDFASASPAAVSIDALADTTLELTQVQKETLEKMADKYVADMTEIYRKDLKNLNVLAIGDSLFEGVGLGSSNKGAQWINRLAKECGWNLTNLGIGGSTMSYTNANKGTNTRASIYNNVFNNNSFTYGSTSNSLFYNYGKPSGDADDVHVILLEAGSNDYGYKVGTPLGEIGTEDPETFLGAWNAVTKKLLEDYPNAIIIFIPTWENVDQTRADGALAIPYTQSVLDLYREVYADNPRVYAICAGAPGVSGVDIMNDTWRASYCVSATDRYHLNADGMKIMAEHMLPLIWDIVENQFKY